MSGAGKKRKAGGATSASASNGNACSDAESATALKKAKKAEKQKNTNNSNDGSGSDKKKKVVDDGYVPLTLSQIKCKISELGLKVPIVPPEGLDPTDSDSVRKWATSLQAVIEEFNLLLCCVSSATYKWGSDRSGAADQNLGVLSSELGNAQDQISTSVTPRLTNVLAPVVDLVIQKTVTTKRAAAEGEKDEDGNELIKGGEVEVKTNHFTRERVDPDFIRLCDEILCRNARMLRQVVLANFHKIDKVIGDYEEATKKDSQHDGRGFAY